jgi:hypothetical protein
MISDIPRRKELQIGCHARGQLIEILRLNGLQCIAAAIKDGL